jgi:RNA polymerase sigma-70 factor, ECF subfamily
MSSPAFLPTDDPSKTHEFNGLMRRSYSRAYSTAYRLVGNATDAEDLIQEAYVRVWSAFDRYDRSRPFETWLMRILSNLAIDRWRRKNGVTFCSLDAEINTPLPMGQTPPRQRSSLLTYLADDRVSVMPEASSLRAEEGSRVRRALNYLPGDYRMAVVLADVQGWSYEEIAEQAGCPVGTIRSRLHRGRKLLKQTLLRMQRQEEEFAYCV